MPQPTLFPTWRQALAHLNGPAGDPYVAFPGAFGTVQVLRRAGRTHTWIATHSGRKLYHAEVPGYDTDQAIRAAYAAYAKAEADKDRYRSAPRTLPAGPDILSARELAARLGITVGTLRNKRRKYPDSVPPTLDLPHSKPKWSRQVVDAWLVARGQPNKLFPVKARHTLRRAGTNDF